MFPRITPSLSAALLVLGLAQPVAADPAYRTVVVFGDVQHMTWADRPDYAIFVELVDWVLANKSAENIDFVLNAGDVIQNGFHSSYPLDSVGCTETEDPNGSHPDCVSNPVAGECFATHDGTYKSCGRALYQTRVEWDRFNAQWARLESAGIPNALVAGNHANEGGSHDPNNPFDRKGFAEFYGPTHLTGKPGYLASSPPNAIGISNAWKFTFDPSGVPKDVLVIGLPFEWPHPDPHPMDDHTAWANGVIAEPTNAGLPVILLKHALLNGGLGTGRIGWRGVAQVNPDRVAVGVMGHLDPGEIGIVTETNPSDPNAISYDILAQRSNWQGSAGDASSWLTLMRFYFDENQVDEVEIEAISPALVADHPNDPGLWFDRDPQDENKRWRSRQPFSIDHDIDHDGVTDSLDNCPLDANPGLEDADSDGIGDVCDNCPTVANGEAEGAGSQQDRDGDQLGDLCDPDLDADGVENWNDVCPFTGPQDASVSTQTGLEGFPCDCLCGDVDGSCTVSTDDVPVITQQIVPNLGLQPGCENDALDHTCGTPQIYEVDGCDADGNSSCGGADALLILDSIDDLGSFPLPLANGYHPSNCWPSAPDVDGDGVPDLVDNCPQVANPGQEASTQDGLVGIGCACLCGDVNDSCSVNGLDVQSILTQIVFYLDLQTGCTDTPAGLCGIPQTKEPRGCDANGGGTCSGVDAQILLEAQPLLVGTPTFPLANGYSPFNCAQDSPDPSPAP